MKRDAGKERARQAIGEIKHNYRKIERSIVEQLFMKQKLHGATLGTQREDIWQQLFEMILPKKFVVEHSIFIIDSAGAVSKEVDLAVIDSMYTPYIFCYGKIKFIPIEAVAIVVECKSSNLKTENLMDWSAGIKELKTNNNSIARMANGIGTGCVSTQQSTRPILILCTLTKNLSPEIRAQFDFTLIACQNEKENSSDASILCEASKKSNLYEWFRELNFHNAFEKSEKSEKSEKEKKQENKLREDLKKDLNELKIKDEEDGVNSLLTFNFQLNQLLMLINNPLLFPHQAYVDMFNKGEENA